MILAFALACSQDSMQVQEVEEAEKKVAETISSIAETLAKNEAELKEMESELEKARAKNAASTSLDGHRYTTCIDVCADWLKMPDVVPKLAYEFFEFHARLFC